MSSGFTPINQVRLTNVAYVRLNKLGHRFEIACYRNKVVNWRNKIETDINEVLQIQNIFSNVSKGMLASKADLMEAFGTTNENIICAEILEKGDLQVTELERQALIDGMFRDVATIVTEKSINTETERPYTITMIQNAMKDIHYSVSLTKNAKQQALDVIRKLRKVMPIARLLMSLRITLQTSLCNNMREFLLQKSATILKDTSTEENSNNNDNNNNTNTQQSVGIFEVSIDPEHYRSIQEYVDQISQGKGLLEILHQSTSSITSSSTNTNTAATTTAITNLQDNNQDLKNSVEQQDNDQQNIIPQKNTVGNVGSKKSKIKGKSGTNDLPIELTTKLTLEDSLDEDNEIPIHHEDVVIGIAKNKNKNKKKKTKEVVVEKIPVHDGDDSDDNVDEQEETQSIQTSLSIPSTQNNSKPNENNQPKKNKVGKKNKRLEKEKQKESEEREKEREIKLNKLQEVNEQKNQNNNEIVSSTESSNSSNVAGSNTGVGAGAGGRCNTCQISFETPADYRSHYRSNWHRINLKRKMKKLPLATSEIEFESHPIEYWDVDIVSSST